MVLKLPTIEVFTSLLYKDGIPKRYLPDVFLTKSEANLYAKAYLSLRQKKKLSIKIETIRVTRENTIT